ncbi:hypothetical protein DIPPA_25885 [Diplonema papillatum]|nr:hypothetical protein DIPPA_25885 [Diplonema papillatum]
MGDFSSPEACEYQEDENYVPTSNDIREYAVYLGIDPLTESDLMWIAEEGVSARLPEGWKPCSTKKGQVYYFNTGSGQSSWTHPKDVEFKEVLAAERAKRRKRLQEEVGKQQHQQQQQQQQQQQHRGSVHNSTAFSNNEHEPQSYRSVPAPPVPAEVQRPLFGASPVPAATSYTTNNSCTKLKVLSKSDKRVIQQVRVGGSTTFASIAAVVGGGGRSTFCDSDGFVFPPSDLVQTHFSGPDTAVVYT